MANENENWKTERWVFLGNYTGKDEKTVSFRLIDSTGKRTDEVMSITLKKRSRFGIGAEYDVEVLRNGEDLTARVSSAKYIGIHKDREYVQELGAKQRIFVETMRNKATEAKYKNGLELPDNWQEIVVLYSKLSYAQRQVFGQLLLSKLDRASSALRSK